MKRLFVILGVVALSAATTLATLRVANTISSDNLPEATLSTSPFSENAATDALFAASVVPAEYPDLTYAAENAVKAVVNIVATKQVDSRQYFDPFFEFFGYPSGGTQQQREAKAGGSGVIISEDGYIVTNNHVIEGASKLRVTLPDGRAFDAKTIGTDPATDVALIKIEASGLPTLPFGSSDDLRLGEWVLAIGYPMELQSTITAGIVSAKARQLGALNNRYGIESFIQTDAAVNPGILGAVRYIIKLFFKTAVIGLNVNYNFAVRHISSPLKGVLKAAFDIIPHLCITLGKGHFFAALFDFDFLSDFGNPLFFLFGEVFQFTSSVIYALHKFALFRKSHQELAEHPPMEIHG